VLIETLADQRVKGARQRPSLYDATFVHEIVAVHSTAIVVEIRRQKPAGELRLDGAVWT
jgi:hypothetical protein